MNYHPPINHNNVTQRTLADWSRIRAIKEAQTRHFMAMQAEVHLLAMELDTVDADQFMVDWRGQFDPYFDGPIQDGYSDAFGPVESKLHEVCNDPYKETRGELPSGLCKPRETA